MKYRLLNINYKSFLLISINIFLIIFKIYDIKSKWNYINVAYACDNNYYYIMHVSMKSLMINQENNTFVNFFLMVHESIYEEQKIVIDKICKEHTNCKINYFIMSNEFKDITTTGDINCTTSTYYRLLLQKLLPKEKRVLYLDSDTIIYKDLNKLYNYNIKNNYYVGVYEGKPLSKYGKNLRDFINGGTILINLEKLRKDKIYEKMYNFLRKNNASLSYLDQDAINVVCNKKNGFFPVYYVSSGICDETIIKNINKHKFTNTEMIQYFKEPYIFHFIIYKKPWLGIAKNKNNKMICFDFFSRFYEYARKTSYYFEILENFRVYD